MRQEEQAIVGGVFGGDVLDAKGVEAAIFCANCHDPERALKGTVAQDLPKLEYIS